MSLKVYSLSKYGGIYLSNEFCPNRSNGSSIGTVTIMMMAIAAAALATTTRSRSRRRGGGGLAEI
jgi:phosphotransferase system  glucose/maltose/N-acetylglucosamine-specific IIC component